MTAVTMTQFETLFVMPSPGTSLTNTVTKTLISGNTTTDTAYQLPALTSLWPNVSSITGKAIKVVARGLISTAASAQGTLTMALQLDPAQNSSTSALTLAATGAFTPAASLAAGNWELELDFNISAFGVTAAAYSATLQCHGLLTIGPGNNAATAAGAIYTVGAANIAMSGASVNPGLASWCELWATWGTASASNSIQCTQMFVYGQN